MKKFFPGDEEDMYTSEDRHYHSVVNARPQRSSQAAFDSSWTNGSDHIPETSRSLRDAPFEPKMDHQDNPVELSQPDVSTAIITDVDPRPVFRDRSKALNIVDPPFSPTDNQDIPTDVLSVSSHKDLYRIVNQVGEGTFGKVYKAQNTLRGGHVALKRIRMESEKDGFPVTAMREIKLLQSLQHDNVVRLYEMMVSRGKSHSPYVWSIFDKCSRLGFYGI